MKLKNKLLPLVGIGTACAAVAPIALTSCSNSGLVDLTQKYHTTITDIPGSDTWSKDKTEETYFSNAKANPNILIDDYYWSKSFINIYYNTEAWISTDSYFVVGDYEKMSNISFNKHVLEGSDIWTISFEKQVNIVVEDREYVLSDNTCPQYSLYGTIRCVNAPVKLYFNKPYGIWHIYIQDYDYSPTNWNALWAEDIESYINFDTTVHTNWEYDDSTGTYITGSNYTYKFKLYDEDSFDMGLTILDNDGWFSLPYYNALDLGYSHYLFNIIPSK